MQMSGRDGQQMVGLAGCGAVVWQKAQKPFKCVSAHKLSGCDIHERERDFHFHFCLHTKNGEKRKRKRAELKMTTMALNRFGCGREFRGWVKA
jgi:hypothetical protein